jgi:hypothetical protein
MPFYFSAESSYLDVGLDERLKVIVNPILTCVKKAKGGRVSLN